MRSALTYGAAGAVLYALFLLVTLPAAQAWQWMHERAPALTLYGVNGTVWSGQASFASVGSMRLEDVHWTLHPWALLWGRTEAALNFVYQDAPGGLVVSRSLGGAVHLTGMDVRLPGRQLETLLALPGTELGGVLQLRLNEFSMEEGKIAAAEGSLIWAEASLRRPVAARFGAFEVALATAEDGIGGNLKDQGGPVQAEGLFKLQPDGHYQFTATFRSRDAQQPLLAQGLQIFGNPGPDGRIKYSTQGTLPPLLSGQKS